LKFFEFEANFAEISIGTPFYPFFKKNFNGSKVLCLASLIHKYHQHRLNRKKVTINQNLSNKKIKKFVHKS